MNRTKVIAVICSTVFAVLLSGCGGGKSGNATIGGTVTGLAAGTSVSLTNNGGTLISVSNGNFSFPGTIASAGGYSVAVSTQPTGQTCVVTYGSGVIDYSGNDVSNVTVKCAPNVQIGVSVATLTAGNIVTFNLILQNNPGNVTTLPVTGIAGTAPVTANFATLLPLGTVYSVSVNTQPGGNTTPGPTQVCTADSPSNASGGVVGATPIVIDFTCK